MISLSLLTPGVAARAQLDKLRASINALLEEREEISSATLPAADAFEGAMKAIRTRAELAENRLAHFASPAGAFLMDEPAIMGNSEKHFVMPTSKSAIDLWASQWSVMPEAVEKGLRAYFQSICKDSGMSVAKRNARLLDIDRELALLRDQEEVAWCELLGQNLLVEHAEIESDRDIDRILRVWDVVPA